MKIFIDYGHGGSDPGACSNGVTEANIVLNIGKMVKADLERHQQVVITSRDSDKTVSLEERSHKSNINNCDIFVSLHCNAFRDSEAHGFEVYHWKGSSKGEKLAKGINYEFKKAKLISTDRGIKTANFHVLRETKCIAALFEIGFITNYKDRQVLLSKQREIATAITKGILRYYEIRYKKEQNDTDDDNIIYRVQVGAFKDINNANILKDKLDSLGYSAIIKKCKI